MDIISNNYLPGDQRLIEQIVRELKSQGIFDQFRKECISDVDTKPAYQNLRQRVESSVSGFLTKQTWNPEMNKNQVREMLRKNIYESGFLETGVERIVDQVVNPKITTVFLTKVEDIVYKFLGIEKPIKVEANVATPIKINSFHDLLPNDLEAISPEMPEEKDMEIKDVKMEEESPSYEILNEKKEKLVQEENSVDSSQSSILSGIISNDSNPSQKQDSLMSLNSSESRMSLVISENTSKIEGEDIFLSQKSSDSNPKVELQMDEKMEIEVISQDAKKEFRENLNSIEDKTNQNDVTVERTFDEINSKLKDSINKKREKHHSSSERLKSRSDKDKTRSDKHKKDEKDPSKEQKIEKEKYRIPKLSDKIKTDKVGKEKDIKSREKSDKNVKSDRDKKSDKDKKSSKHSSERDRSKSDSKNKKDSKSDKKDKEKDDKREKKDSSRNEKSKEEKKSSSSSSSKKKENSSSKERSREKDKDNKKTNEESPEKNKNGHSSSTTSSSKKDSSSTKYKKDDEKCRSSKKKDDKNDKDDKKKKKSSKDDHYSSKEKKNGRRSSDRDSDGPPNSKVLPATPQKNFEKYSQKVKQDSSHSTLENSTDDTGNKDKIEDRNEECGDTLQLEMQKIKLPKFASNLQEAMKIMKIRKQLKKFENINKLSLENLEVKKLLKDIAELTKDGKKDKKGDTTENEKVDETTEHEVNTDSNKALAIDINDFISSSNINMAKWNALEAKFMEEMGCIDYDSYESPYLDDEELPSVEKTNCDRIEKILDKVQNKKQANLEEDFEISDNNKDDVQITENKDILINEVEINSLETDKIILSSIAETEDKYVKNTNGEIITTEIVPEEIIEETVSTIEDAVQITEVAFEHIEVAETEYLEETCNNIEETVNHVEEIVEHMERSVETLDEAVVNIASTVENVKNSVTFIDESVDNTQIVENIEKSDEIKQNTATSVEKFEGETENSVNVFKNKIGQFGETIRSNTEQSTSDEEKFGQLTLDRKKCTESNLLTFVSKQPDPVTNTLEIDVQLQNEPQTNTSKPSKHPIEAKKSSILKKFSQIEDCSRKAIVLLEKHTLTEELIKNERNGKHITQENVPVNLKGDTSLDTEKENIEVNKMITVEKSVVAETHSSLENDAKHVRNLEKNQVSDQTDVQKIKNSVDHIEEKVCQNNEIILSKASNQNVIENHCRECGDMKTFDRVYHKSDGAHEKCTVLVVNTEQISNEEEPCLGFEAADNGRNLTILKCLIKSFEDDIKESMKKIEQLKYTKEQKIMPHTRKRKVKEDKSDISNNNLENAGSKRRRTRISPNPLVPKKLKSTQEKEAEITDIALDNKFSLPLSPAESESSEKRDDAHVVGTKSRRSIKLTSSNVKTTEECDGTPTNKKFKSPPKNSSGRKSTRQRYSSEDLYKPRIFLRRTRNGQNNS